MYRRDLPCLFCGNTGLKLYDVRLGDYAYQVKDREDRVVFICYQCMEPDVLGADDLGDGTIIGAPSSVL